MRLLGIGRSHDSNFCLYDSESDFFQYIKLERESGVKHAGMCVDSLFSLLLDYDFVPDAIAFDWDDLPDRSTLHGHEVKDLAWLSQRSWQDDVERNARLIAEKYPKASLTWVSHHYAHALSAWLGFGTDFDYAVAVDGRGPNNNTTVIYKEPFGCTEILYRSNVGDEKIDSFGNLFLVIGEMAGLGGSYIDYAGKLMGAHAYGNPDMEFVNGLDLPTVSREIGTLIHKYRFDGEMRFENQAWLDWLATIHKAWEAALEWLVLKYVPQDASVAFSGGAAQNTVFNERIKNLYPRAEFVPHCYDGGLSIGILASLCRQHGVRLPDVDGYPYLQRDVIDEAPSGETIGRVAHLLADGKMVGWHQGRGEVGPRALGNRSILMRPDIEDGKDILNSKVKHREPWRPYAASVLEEHASEWFKTDAPSPYMMRAIPVRESKRNAIPAVTHVDGTCRIQTVSRHQNPALYDLIDSFHEATGIPMLLNTSLNVAGKPISGSRSETTELLSKLDAVCIGDEVMA